MTAAPAKTYDLDPALDRLRAEGLIGTSAAAREFPGRGGRPTAPSTVFRWMTSGQVRPDGVVVVLESVQVGSRRVTSLAAVGRFFAAMQCGNREVAPAQRTASERDAASEAAGRRLEAAGC